MAGAVTMPGPKARVRLAEVQVHRESSEFA